MSKLENLRQLYYQTVQEMLDDTDKWKAFLQYASNMYKYDFATLVTAYAQNPNYVQLASYDDWKSIGRQVRRNEKSIPVLIKNQYGIDHFFDSSQLWGNKQIMNWSISAEELDDFNHRFMEKYKDYNSEFILTPDDVRQMLITDQLKGAYNKTNNPVNKAALLSDYLINSINYMIQYRYHGVEPKILIHKSAEVNSETIGTVGYYTVKAAREILLTSKEIIIDIRKEKRDGQKNDRDDSERDGNGIRREGGTLVRSGRRGAEPGNGATDQIRKSGDEVLGRRETSGVTADSDRRQTKRNHAEDTGTSRGKDGEITGENAGERPNKESKRHNGSLSAQAKDPRPSRGDSPQRSGLQLELNLKELHENIEGETKSVSSFLINRSYGQSILDDVTLTKAVNYGTGIEGSQSGIAKLYNTGVPYPERVKYLQNAYDNTNYYDENGNEGFIGIQTLRHVGIKITWSESSKLSNEIIHWSQLDRILEKMILDNKYIIPIHEDKVAAHKEVANLVYEDKGTVTQNASNIEKINYKYQEDLLSEGGIKKKFQNNVAAIKLLKVIENEQRYATENEQIILNRYVGWGGLAAAFDERNSSWVNEYIVLKELLTEQEYKSARASTTTAFYTPPEIIKGIYKALEQFGFKGGNLLEPALGTGRFFSHIPENIADQTRLYGVELDSISGRIAKQLYQKADIQICSYENANHSDNFFDLVIGNVPFGDYRVFDKRYSKYNYHIHDYYFAKSLDKVRSGGLVIFITSKGTLDKANPTFRKYLAERADLIGAIRLPNITFKDANTEVTSDILFLQKRERIQVSEPSWVFTGFTDDKIPVNQYYLEHPEMMLGKMVFDNKMFGEDSKYTTLVNEDPEHLQDDFLAAVAKLTGRIDKNKNIVMEKEEEIIHTISADPSVKNYSYAIQIKMIVEK